MPLMKKKLINEKIKLIIPLIEYKAANWKEHQMKNE